MPSSLVVVGMGWLRPITWPKSMVCATSRWWNEAQAFGEKFHSGTLVKKQVNKTLLAKSLGISLGIVNPLVERFGGVVLIDHQCEGQFAHAREHLTAP